MKKLRILFIGIICCLSIQANAQSDDERATSEIEYAVKTISAESVVAASYTFSSVLSNYFEAVDENGFKIYASKK